MFWNRKEVVIHIGNTTGNNRTHMGATIVMQHFKKFKHHSVVGFSVSIKRKGDSYNKKIGRQRAVEYSAKIRQIKDSSPTEENNFRLLEIGCPIIIPNSLNGDNAIQGYIISLLQRAILFTSLEEMPLRHDDEFVYTGDGSLPDYFNRYNLNTMINYLLGDIDYSINFSQRELSGENGIINMLSQKIDDIKASISNDSKYTQNHIANLVCSRNSLDVINSIGLLSIGYVVGDESIKPKKNMKSFNNIIENWATVQSYRLSIKN